MDLITRFYFAMEIPGLEKLLLGNKNESRRVEKGQVLTSYDASSLVVDRLGDQARGQGAAIACFYFDFAARKEQSSVSVMGALLKQIVSGLEEIPEEIAEAYEDQKQVLGGRGPELAAILQMLHCTASIKPIFIFIDALDECAARDRVKILDSLHEILQGPPGTRVFVTGRSYIEAEVGKRLSGMVTAMRITPRRDDMVSYLHSRLDEDATPDAMDSSLKADILKKIPEDNSEMWVEATTPENLSQVIG